MAGGVKKPVNIFKLKNSDEPKEIFNWRLFYLTATVAFAGCAYGFDQGNIGGVLTLPSFRKAFGLDELSPEDEDAREGNIAAMSRIDSSTKYFLDL